MLMKLIELKDTFEGKFIAVLMSVVLVFSMSTFSAFAENDVAEQGEPASEIAVDSADSAAPAGQDAVTDSGPDVAPQPSVDQQVVADAVQHGTDAGNAAGNVVETPIVSNAVDEAVVTFETENAYVSVNDQILYAPTLTTELHKELKFVASADTGYTIESVKAKNSAYAEVPVNTVDGVSTIAGDYVDSTCGNRQDG